MNKTEAAQISRVFFCFFFNNKLTLEERRRKKELNRSYKTISTYNRRKKKKSKSKMNVFSRYTLYLV
jgi:hypothetical protein